MADHELIEEHERDRFAETSAMRNDPDQMRDEPGETRHRESVASEEPRRSEAPTAGATGTEPAGPTDQDRNVGDYQQGREDEAREREGGLSGRFKRSEDEQPADRPTGSRQA